MGSECGLSRGQRLAPRLPPKGSLPTSLYYTSTLTLRAGRCYRFASALFALFQATSR
jgi:hypothetical protein